jgi:hypothetical protein
MAKNRSVLGLGLALICGSALAAVAHAGTVSSAESAERFLKNLPAQTDLSFGADYGLNEDPNPSMYEAPFPTGKPVPSAQQFVNDVTDDKLDGCVKSIHYGMMFGLSSECKITAKIREDGVSRKILVDDLHRVLISYSEADYFPFLGIPFLIGSLQMPRECHRSAGALVQLVTQHKAWCK